MTLSFYQASIPNFIRILENLSGILTKAEAYAAERKFDPAVLVNGRLAPDMYPLSRQIQIASDLVKGFAARIAGHEVPSYPDNETTFPGLQGRIGKTIAYLKTFTVAQIEKGEDKTVALKLGGREVSFAARPYLFGFVMPNLYFHVTVAYSILRHNGLAIGKADYLGDLDTIK